MKISIQNPTIKVGQEEFEKLYKKLHEDDYDINKDPDADEYIELIKGDPSFIKKELKRLGIKESKIPLIVVLISVIILVILLMLKIPQNFVKNYGEAKRQQQIENAFGRINLSSEPFDDFVISEDKNGYVQFELSTNGNHDTYFIVIEGDISEEQYLDIEKSFKGLSLVKGDPTNVSINVYKTNIFYNYKTENKMFIVEFSGLENNENYALTTDCKLSKFKELIKDFEIFAIYEE